MFLKIEGLRFAYPGCPVFDGLAVDWQAGLALVHGPESCGKTTLLRILAGELVPAKGRMTLCGAPLGAATAQVFWQDPRGETLEAACAEAWLNSLPARYPAWDKDALAAHVQGFSLIPHLAKPFHALSTGSRRKVLMAAALASGATLTLIDEPLAGLDKPSASYLVDALSTAAHQPARLVVVAHHEVLPGMDAAQALHLGA